MYTSKCNGGKQGRGRGIAGAGVGFCFCVESGQERPHPKVRVPEKKGDRVGVWEKSTPHRGSLRWERFLCSRNSQGASVQDGNEPLEI